ncbi:ABC transporter permease [Dactylosporangium vinaceum]|uniref:ABC transporter permease n=1 Tax=Dactylosporangium vinaceum TaxID=53362 RepID=A0ABV5M315_9ACTN|nr:ABC transporter permease [Dactylosporangium vinaceum]UAB99808.1 ABC transporter permease [Dactylosporangium vinaceum]
MARFLLRRLALLALGLLVASLAIFVVLRVLPGDVAELIAGTNATPEQVAGIRAGLGLDRSLPSQYLGWLGGLLHLDFGRSLLTNQSVTAALAERAGVTVPLTALSFVIAVTIALTLGVYSGLRHDRPAGIAIGFVAQALAAVPALWLGLLLVVLFGAGVGLVGVLPSNGFPDDGWHEPGPAVAALVLPAVTIGLIEGVALLRFVRSAVLDALGQDYVRAAAARGLTRTQALLRHGLPNVGLSLLSVSALQIAALVTGAVVIESLFNLPGVGRMLVGDVGSRDLTKVQGEVLFMTGIVLVIGTLVDIAHRLVDPRQRVEAP